MIKAVIFDLDDTLYPEKEYVKSGFNAIGKYFGNPDLAEKLWSLFSENPKDVYQRFGFSPSQCNECIRIYRDHTPHLVLNPDTKLLLESLSKNGYRLGIITDGTPSRQWSKIKALGLEKMMNHIIVTDEFGGIEFRKPNPIAFEKMKSELGIEYNEMMYVGDNPHKDFYISKLYPIVTVRFYNSGIYSDNRYRENIKEMYSIDSLSQLSDIL